MPTVQMILKDNSAQTEMETAKTLQDMSERYMSSFRGRIKPKTFGERGCEQTLIEYRGSMCSKYEIPIIFELDKSGVLRKNVVGLNVIYGDSKPVYHNVGYVMRRIAAERAERQSNDVMEDCSTMMSLAEADVLEAERTDNIRRAMESTF